MFEHFIQIMDKHLEMILFVLCFILFSIFYDFYKVLFARFRLKMEIKIVELKKRLLKEEHEFEQCRKDMDE